MKGYNVAIVGATGLVGQECIKVLEQRKFPMESVSLLASDRSAGKKLFVNHKEVEVKETSHESFDGVDIAFFAVETGISKPFAPIAVNSGAVVILKNKPFLTDPSVPPLLH